MATLTISLKTITSEVKFAERKSALLQNNNVWKKILPLFKSYKIYPRRCIAQRTTLWANDILSSLYREKYTKTQRLSPRFSSGAKLFSHVSHSTELVRRCLACQHFDFNSADWISHNLHVISGWYLRTMGKEFLTFGSADVRGTGTRDEPPKNVCLGGY